MCQHRHVTLAQATKHKQTEVQRIGCLMKQVQGEGRTAKVDVKYCTAASSRTVQKK
jgi:hypothetical protein